MKGKWTRIARRGFALITVLWVMVAASVIGLAGALAAREDVDVARNRVDGERAAWRAHDCLERARAAADGALEAVRRESRVEQVWRELDRQVLASPLIVAESCTVWLEAAGARLDINAAGETQLVALFDALRAADPHALADRLLDWRDTDEDPRANGAERDWYALRRRLLPRNGPFADVRELARVAGFETLATFDTVLGVEPGHIPMNSAPLTVLASLPGFTQEVLARIALDRESGRQITDILALGATVSRASADSIMAHFHELARITTVNPDAWIVLARGQAGSPPTFAYVEARVVLDDHGVAVTRHRSWR